MEMLELTEPGTNTEQNIEQKAPIDQRVHDARILTQMKMLLEQNPNLFEELERTHEHILRQQNQKKSVCRAAFVPDKSIRWSKNMSWCGIILHIFSLCFCYTVGYYFSRTITKQTSEHTWHRIVGDLVSVAWFGLGFVALPWHEWEEFTCLQTKNWCGVLRYFVWLIGILGTIVVYDYSGQFPAFRSSLANQNMTFDQTVPYIVVFSLMFLIICYWFVKLLKIKKFEQYCRPKLKDKVTFIRLFLTVVFLFGISAVSCSLNNSCTYHLHHWWFGFVLVLISTSSLDNGLDYLFQGIFYGFLIEAIYKYGLTFSHFFI